MNGVLIIDKPTGLTSHDVVNRVRRILQQPSVGHLGTLDPLATGVLPLVTGNLTRLAQFYGASGKTYEGVIRFGFATDTYDSDGEAQSPVQEVNVSPEQIRPQVRPPPATSAQIQAGGPPEKLLKPEELAALVAPIALYPDNLLSLVLMASTYPVEVVQAERWAKENKKLKGDQLKAAVDKQPLDDSVKSLVATPDVLAMMSSKLDWTVKLGEAVLAQQSDVMDAIQSLRARADANNKLTSTKQQKVTKTQQGGKTIIAIEPTDPNMLYVPYWDPGVVYGAWPYAEYPPYYW